MPSRSLCGVVAAHRNKPPAYASYGETGDYRFPEDAWPRRAGRTSCSPGAEAHARGHTMRPASLALRLLPPLVGWCAVAATALPAASPLRTLPVVAFLLAGPGAAVVRVCAPALRRYGAGSREDGFTRDSDRLEQLVLALFLSVSAAVLCATALLAAGSFSGLRLLVLLAAATTVAACCPRLIGRAPATRSVSPPRKGPVA